MDVYFSIDPLIRGGLWATAAFLLVEIWKPGFAFAESDGTFYPRPFGSSSVAYTETDDAVQGTNFPWWAFVLSFFVIFGLFI